MIYLLKPVTSTCAIIVPLTSTFLYQGIFKHTIKKQTNKQTKKKKNSKEKKSCHKYPKHVRARNQIPVVGVTGRALGWPGALKLPGAAV